MTKDGSITEKPRSELRNCQYREVELSARAERLVVGVSQAFVKGG